MIASAIMGAAGAATQVGSAIYGQVETARLNKKAQAELDQTRQWYNQKMDEDYVMRSDVQNVLRKQRELLKEQYQRARATNIVAGGTDESLSLQQQEANRAMGETMANIASNASAYKDSIRAKLDNLSQQQQQIYANQAEQVKQAASQASQAGGTLLSSGLGGIAKVGGN